MQHTTGEGSEKQNYSLANLLKELISSSTAFVEEQIDRQLVEKLRLSGVSKEECAPLLGRINEELQEFSAEAGPGEDLDTNAEVTEEFLEQISEKFPVIALIGRNYISTIQEDEPVNFTVQMLMAKARVFCKNFENLINEL